MDKIFLDELKIDTIIGLWDWERKIRQTVVIDLEMSADIAKAAATDDVADPELGHLVRQHGECPQ